MIARPREVADLDIQDGLDELQGLIRAQYPDAAFEAFPNDDPPGIYFRITVDVDEPGDVIDAILPRLVAMQLDGLPIYPVAVRPNERVIADLDARARRGSTDELNGNS